MALARQLLTVVICGGITACAPAAGLDPTNDAAGAADGAVVDAASADASAQDRATDSSTDGAVVDVGPDVTGDAAGDAARDGAVDAAVDAAADAASVQTWAASGTIYNADSNQPMSGATITVVDAPSGSSFSTTSASNGTFSISVARSIPQTVRVSKAGFVSVQRPLYLTAARTGIQISLSAPATWAAISNQAGLPTRDTNTGLFYADFETVSSGSTYSVTIAQSHQGSFAYASGGSAVAASMTQPGGYPLLGFYNVSPGTTTMTVGDPAGPIACAKKYPLITTYRVDVNVATNVEVVCQ